MHAIRVESVSAEEVDHGVTELWAEGALFAYTIYDEGSLMLRIEPSRDGGPVQVDVRRLSDALAEVERVLSSLPTTQKGTS